LRVAIRVCRFHRYDVIAPSLAITVQSLYEHAVLLDLELNFLANRQKYGVLQVRRPDVILHIVCSQQVLRAKLLVGIHVCDARGCPQSASPVKPFSFAPQGTASIVSSMARDSGLFFLLSALTGMAARKMNTETAKVLTFMMPP
jgi:hypothetical protein